MTGPFGSGLLADWTFENAAPEWSGISFIGADDLATSSSGSDLSHLLEIHLDGLGRFRIDTGSRRVVATSLYESLGAAGLSHLLLDQVAPRILAQLGHLVLHASAVEIDGRLALFLGDSGAGKSTLAASFHASGFGMLGDDALVMSRSGEAFLGQALYRSLRMYPETAREVLGRSVQTQPIAEYSEKRRVSLQGPPAMSQLPIGALFFLHCPEVRHPPQVTRRTAGEACIGLLQQSFSLDPGDASAARQRLAHAAAVANAIPAYDLSYPDGLELLPDVRALVISAISGQGRGQAEAGTAKES